MELLTIGAFARAAGLTAKALRLYDEQGLLRPAAVDAVTGYRLYAPDQLDRARLIARLRRVDMPLTRIREVCDLPPDSAASVVATFRAGLEADAAARAREAGLLVDLLRGTPMTKLGLTSAARTAIGLVRETNEDVAYADSTVLAVADGLGGLPNGEEASAAAVAAVRAGASDLGELADQVAAAGRTIKAMDGPGTTLTALIRSADKLLLAHIGDTRAYLLRNGELFRLTQDHSYVQTLVDAGKIGAGEAADHPKRAVLVRALGGGNDEPDLGQRALLAGDRYLLCSDGLWAAVPPAGLAAALPGDDPGAVADRLIELAHTHGAPDNVAVVVADVIALVAD
ncbi:MerR family transcriptional regulator [Actinoplanes sp. NBRC 103695]|uniref:MerR family transcriptional regulator n=1 Tax=Actinoplanes sp. NBRC 103695 TaxID=3032202 RepID=UPI0024A3D514|nr:MerR family transcriptional regulator [Actinoplanes sp. NBRC 103695]GLY94257.1 hypothetical protein Acsp02_15130 [Actinoplanes sp. NBRC 103695]